MRYRCTRHGRRAARSILIAGLLTLTSVQLGWAADSNQPPPATPSENKGAADKPADFDPNAVFRNICGFCHEDGGRRAAKGPQLMNSALTDEQLFNRIKNGKPGRMAAFGGAFTDDQIKVLVAYIRALKPRQ